MGLLTTILTFFGAYSYILCFLGAFFGGEETVILLSVIASNGYMSIWTVVFFCYLGIMASDTMWYYIGRTSVFEWLIKRKGISTMYYKWGRLLDRATKGSDFQALLITKFFYGFRIITIMYLARKRLKLQSFINYSLIVVGLWIAVIVSFGWLAAKGVKSAVLLTNNLTISLIILGLFCLAFIVLMRVVSSGVKKWLIKGQKQ